MTERRPPDLEADDGLVAEDVSQFVEHIELTGEQPLPDGTDWELMAPADLEDAPLLLDTDMLRPAEEPGEIAPDLELFTETELDLNQRLRQVEDEQLELAAALAGERSRWEQRVAALEAELTARNRIIAEREAEIGELSARLASMTLERDGLRADLREQRHQSGPIEPAVQAPPDVAGETAIRALRERMHERGRALLVAREEIDRLRADREQLVAGLAERGDFIQQLHVRLRELESGQRRGDLHRILRRFFGGHEPVPPQPDAPAPVAAPPGPLEDPTPRRVVIEDGEPPRRTAEPQAGTALRHYLISVDPPGHVHELERARSSVGRTNDNDLRIMDPTVSRLHAVLKRRGRTLTVIDADSRNGVFVNGVQVRHAELTDGDQLAFGSVCFRYRTGAGPGGGHGTA
ncbi:MAG: FHA domain-containing protein [Gammaproteobacteria bacterium]|nr:FHA domain-containing protein [Gammaproteobacteria bacterium]